MTHRRTVVRQALADILTAAFGDRATVITAYANQTTVDKPVILVAPITEERPEDGASIDGAQFITATIEIVVYTTGIDAWKEADEQCLTIEAAIADADTLTGTVTGLAYDGFEPGDVDAETGVYLATVSYTANYLVRA